MDDTSLQKTLDLLDVWYEENREYLTEEDIDMYIEAHARLYNMGVHVKARKINAILAKEVTC
jgi:hypothetical protein